MMEPPKKQLLYHVYTERIKQSQNEGRTLQCQKMESYYLIKSNNNVEGLMALLEQD